METTIDQVTHEVDRVAKVAEATLVFSGGETAAFPSAFVMRDGKTVGGYVGAFSEETEARDREFFTHTVRVLAGVVRADAFLFVADSFVRMSVEPDEVRPPSEDPEAIEALVVSVQLKSDPDHVHHFQRPYHRGDDGSVTWDEMQHIAAPVADVGGNIVSAFRGILDYLDDDSEQHKQRRVTGTLALGLLGDDVFFAGAMAEEVKAWETDPSVDPELQDLLRQMREHGEADLQRTMEWTRDQAVRRNEGEGA